MGWDVMSMEVENERPIILSQLTCLPASLILCRRDCPSQILLQVQQQLHSDSTYRKWLLMPGNNGIGIERAANATEARINHGIWLRHSKYDARPVPRSPLYTYKPDPG